MTNTDQGSESGQVENSQPPGTAVGFMIFKYPATIKSIGLISNAISSVTVSSTKTKVKIQSQEMSTVLFFLKCNIFTFVTW